MDYFNAFADPVPDNGEPKTVAYRGMDFTVTKGVFFPGTHSGCGTHFFTDMLAKQELKGSMIEIGCGSGVTGLSLLRFSIVDFLTATDISMDAVNCARENSRRLGVAHKTDIFRSDVFDAIGERYVGATYWNSPWSYVRLNDKRASRLDPTLYDPGYALLTKYVSDARKFLSHEGRCFLGSGHSANTKALWAICQEFGCEPSTIASHRVGDIPALVLYELVRPTGATCVQLPKDWMPAGAA